MIGACFFLKRDGKLNIIKSDNKTEIVSLKENDVGTGDFLWDLVSLYRAHLECSLDALSSASCLDQIGPVSQIFSRISLAETSRT